MQQDTWEVISGNLLSLDIAGSQSQVLATYITLEDPPQRRRYSDADKLTWLQSFVAHSEHGLPSLVKMLSAADADVRCSAMWALSHLVNDAMPAMCEAVMAALPWDHFSTLLQDTSSAVQVGFCHTYWAILCFSVAAGEPKLLQL